MNNYGCSKQVTEIAEGKVVKNGEKGVVKAGARELDAMATGRLINSIHNENDIISFTD